MINKLKKGFLLACWLALLPSYSIAQEPRVAIEPRAKAPSSKGIQSRKAPDIRVDSTLVMVNVTVIDPLGRLVAGLEKENFKIFENGAEQDVAYLSVENVPVSVGMVFDVSGSIGEKLQKSRDAVTRFLKMADKDDEFFLMQFSDRPELTIGFTKNIGEIENKLVFSQSKGLTALLDAIMLAINQMKQAQNTRKALLVISDGGENNSRYTSREVRRIIQESDIQIYTIGIFEPLSNRTRTPEELSGEELLANLAQQTGGREFTAENPSQLSDIARKIGIELRSQYMLYFSSKNKEKDGKYRRLKVELTVPSTWPPLRVYYRMGYYAPVQ